MKPLRGPNRRWLFAGTTTIIVAIVIAVSYLPLFKDKPSPECRPVRVLLDFNREQNDRIAGKPDAGPADYRVWADGLADRAAKVEDPALAAHAVKLAGLAGQFVTAYAAVGPNPARADQKPPEAAFRMVALNNQIGVELQQLESLCPAD